MNKRISTLFTASLLFSSVFGSTALAENLKIGSMANKLEAGKYYHLVMNGAGSKYAYGFASYSAEKELIDPTYATVANATDENVDPEAYLWSVQEVSLKSTTGKNEWAYVLTNVKTGKVLRFDANGKALMSTKSADVAASTDQISWGSEFWKYDNSVNSGTNNNSKFDNNRYVFVTALKKGDSSANGLHLSNNSLEISSSQSVFNLYEAATDEVSSDELNQLYNSAGFNLKLDDKYKDVANIFADSRIKAIDVETAVAVENGYSFPAGTYFTVSTPAGSYEDATDKLAYLMDCEFIAVSSTENISQSANEQKEGRGFVFTTVSGRDLNKYTVTDKDNIDPAKQATGTEISVYNACFKVQKNATVSGKYAMSLPNFRYEASVGKYAEKTNLEIAIAEKKYGSSDYLTTQTKGSTPSFIFSFVESNAVLGTSFLNAEGAAIYNIQFVSGQDDDNDELNKYLFAPAYAYALYAKGEVLTEKNNPEFQFVVTDVKGNDVTFTSRANKNVKFTAKLFDEGNDTYSLAVAGDTKFTVLNVEDDGDIEEAASNVKLNLKHIVLSTPESTDMFNGTWNVEDESKVTLSFARDNEPTSNKLYPVVENNNFADNSFDVAEAAQWQLVKSEKPKYQTITYAYRVGEGEDAVVKFVNLGDTTAFYTYKLQVVEDGDAVAKYLDESSNDLKIATNKDNGTDFIIKDNVDGSVSIIADFATLADNYVVSLDEYNVGKKEDLKYFVNKKPKTHTLSETSAATDIKTYLTEEAPEISWVGENGHVTIQSDKGNYVTMDDDRDAILVSSDENVLYLHATDKKAVIPSFFISQGMGAGNAESERMFLFNPTDSVQYYVGEGQYDKQYQVANASGDKLTKAIFKAGSMNANADTLTTNIKGKDVKVAMKADNKGVQGGLNNFKFQIVETEDADGLYYIRQKGDAGKYLYSHNENLVFGANRDGAMRFVIEGASAPTSNESVSASEVAVVAQNGSVVVKNAAGKNVVVSTILGQVVANEVLTSDNATINVPAGIVVVAVEGESFKVNVK